MLAEKRSVEVRPEERIVGDDQLELRFAVVMAQSRAVSLLALDTFRRNVKRPVVLDKDCAGLNEIESNVVGGALI